MGALQSVEISENGRAKRKDVTLMMMKNKAETVNWKGLECVQLTAGGYTDANGVYLYGFQSKAGSRDGFRYIARASYNGKTGPQQEVELKGERTVLELTVGQ